MTPVALGVPSQSVQAPTWWDRQEVLTQVVIMGGVVFTGLVVLVLLTKLVDPDR
jgi:hypothetical protein